MHYIIWLTPYSKCYCWETPFIYGLGDLGSKDLVRSRPCLWTPWCVWPDRPHPLPSITPPLPPVWGVSVPSVYYQTQCRGNSFPYFVSPFLDVFFYFCHHLCPESNKMPPHLSLLPVPASEQQLFSSLLGSLSPHTCLRISGCHAWPAGSSTPISVSPTTSLLGRLSALFHRLEHTHSVSSSALFNLVIAIFLVTLIFSVHMIM